jgi:predicted RNase H-like nuclease (RuvC/YqgF family)
LNVVHCRRKRDHKRVDVDALEEECTKLKEKSKHLLQENRRLEHLVRTANAMVERMEEEQGDPTSAQAETSLPPWSSAELSETRDSISTAVQGLLGLYSPSSAGVLISAESSR